MGPVTRSNNAKGSWSVKSLVHLPSGLAQGVPRPFLSWSQGCNTVWDKEWPLLWQRWYIPKKISASCLWNTKCGRGSTGRKTERTSGSLLKRNSRAEMEIKFAFICCHWSGDKWEICIWRCCCGHAQAWESMCPCKCPRIFLVPAGHEHCLFAIPWAFLVYPCNKWFD